MIVPVRSAVIAVVICAGSVFAGGASLSSRNEVRQHLFAHNTVRAPVPTGPQAGDPGQEKKSVGLAAVYSLLVPGMGELYAGGFESGKYFLIGEGALWLLYATFDVYGDALRDDARAYAVTHAGINPVGKNDQFYVDIGNFLNINRYNEKQLRDREPYKLYDPNAGNAWNWDSDKARAAYREQRLSSERMYNNSNYVIAAVIVNHVGSAINAARTAVAHNSAIDDGIGQLHLDATVMGGLTNPHGILVRVTKMF
jgi:hypothetical protein